MTDKPEPTAEHIDAVARTFSSDRDVCGEVAWTNRFVGEEISRILLTSTDPAVHAAQAANLPTDAMLAALVERGALSEEWTVQHSQGVHPGPFTEASAREWITEDFKRDERRRDEYRGKQALLRRLVSPWEPTP